MVFGLFKKKRNDWKGKKEYKKIRKAEEHLEKTAKRLQDKLEEVEGIPLTALEPYNGDVGEGRISDDTQKKLHVQAYSMEDVAEDGTRTFNGDEIEIKDNSDRWISVACGQLFPGEPNNIIRIDHATQSALGVKAGDTVNVRKKQARSGDITFEDVFPDASLDKNTFPLYNKKTIEEQKKHLVGVNFSGVDLRNVNLTGASLSGANLSNTNFSGMNFSGMNLSGANLQHANLKDVNLSDTNLNNADLTDTDLSGKDLSGANLQHANLQNADLSGANLTDADLIYANLTYTDLSGANLNGADLTYTDLTTVNLTDANLKNVNLTDAYITTEDLDDLKSRGALITRPKLIPKG